MAIKGLTDQGAQFPRIGSIRKGDVKRGNAPGKDLDHFRFTSDDEMVQMAFASVFGDEPKEIDFFLPYGEPDQNFEAWREEWAAGGLKHRCDGETMTVWLEGNKYIRGERPCPHVGKDDKERPCKQTARLSIVIPELRRLGFVTVHTSSTFDIVSISKHLNALYFLLQVRGRDLRGVPMTLRRVERDISTPGPQGRLRRKASLLVIEPKPEWAAFSISQIDRQAMSESVALLDMPRDEAETDAPVETTRPVPTPATQPGSPQDSRRAALLKRWHEVWQRATSEGVISRYGIHGLPGDITNDHLIECGRALSAVREHHANGDNDAAAAIVATINEIVSGYEEHDHPLDASVAQEVPA